MNGKSHATASIVAALPTAAVTALLLGPDVGLCAGVGCLLGIPINPDLDQLTIERAEWKIIKWLPVVGWGWLMIWDLYARGISHRHILSHLPILGTVGRLAYLELWDCGWWLARGQPDPIPVTLAQARLALGVFIGLAVSDTLHWLMDGCPVQVARWGRVLWPRFA